jgi:hypothetical protein
MQHRPAEGAGYHDPLVSIQDGELVIRRYYFPTGAKRIRMASISGVEQDAMGKATGRWRTWGSGTWSTGSTWTQARRHKRQAFVVDLGRRAKPVVTSEDPEAFRAALAAAGIRVSSRAPGGAGQRR